MKKCTKCGKELDDSMVFCNECGSMAMNGECDFPVGNINAQEKQKNDSKQANLNILALISAIVGVLFWFYGFYKYLSYDSGEYNDPVNAYVGGDAYNFIINGTYFTAFSVIGGVFILGAFILYSVNYLKK
jgi:uncharacterized membrane protein YvbJ